VLWLQLDHSRVVAQQQFSDAKALQSALDQVTKP